MKYRILFAGRDEAIISDLFEHLTEEYELMTTSIRYRDIDSHIAIFKPNLYVYCLKNENPADIRRLAEIRSYIITEGVSVVITGTPAECAEFQQMTTNMASLVIEQPATLVETMSKLDSYIKKGKVEESASERKHVLVIDDDPQMLRVIKEMLHDKYDVATAISGKIAYKFLEKKTTDLILLDFEMPEENGPTVLSNIRQIEGMADIPVYFLTGNTERDKIKEAMSLNPQGYLVKPIDKESLISSIKTLIG